MPIRRFYGDHESPEYLLTKRALEDLMEGDIIDGLGNNEDSRQLPDEHDTVVLSSPKAFPSAVEHALAQYADSIELLSTSLRDQIDLYTRGFVAGIRAANKVAANVIRS